MRHFNTTITIEKGQTLLTLREMAGEEISKLTVSQVKDMLDTLHAEYRRMVAVEDALSQPPPPRDRL